MSPLRLLAFGLALGSASCMDEAAELGRPVPVVLSVAWRDLLVALQDDQHLRPAARARLHDAVTELGGAQPLAVRARIRAATAGDADAARRALLGLGVDPARIVIQHAPEAMRLLPAVLLTRAFASTADCSAAIGPAYRGDVAPSLDSLGRCIQQNNLAAMLADPADLVDPVAPSLADAAFQVDGLNARLIQRETALPAAGQFGPSTPGGSAGGGAPSGPGPGSIMPGSPVAAPAPPGVP